MDPDQALADLRRLCRKEHTDATVELFASTFEGLDGWLSSGGFHPQAWQVASVTKAGPACIHCGSRRTFPKGPVQRGAATTTGPWRRWNCSDCLGEFDKSETDRS